MKSKNKYQVGTNYHSLKMSKSLLSSFITAVLLIDIVFQFSLFSCLLVFWLLFSSKSTCCEVTLFLKLIWFLEQWLFINSSDRTSPTFYIPTTSQCLTFFTNHIQILFLDLRLLKLTKNRHWCCQTFSLKT